MLVAIKLERFEHPKGVFFLKRVFSFLKTADGWIVAKCFVGQAARKLEFLVGKNQTGPNTD